MRWMVQGRARSSASNFALFSSFDHNHLWYLATTIISSSSRRQQTLPLLDRAITCQVQLFKEPSLDTLTRNFFLSLGHHAPGPLTPSQTLIYPFRLGLGMSLPATHQGAVFFIRCPIQPPTETFSAFLPFFPPL